MLRVAQKGTSEDDRIFVIGLGNECDTRMIVNLARAGRGIHYVVRDNERNLNSRVINQLSKAMEQYLREARTDFFQEGEEIEEEGDKVLYQDSL